MKKNKNTATSRHVSQEAPTGNIRDSFYIYVIKYVSFVYFFTTATKY